MKHYPTLLANGNVLVLDTYHGVYKEIENKIILDDGTFNITNELGHMYCFKGLTGKLEVDFPRKIKDSHPRTQQGYRNNEIRLAKHRGFWEKVSDFISSSHN